MEEQKLNDLIREMELLNATIKNSNTLILKSLDDSSTSAKSDTNKLIKALGLLSSRMQQASTGISKSADREIAAAKQFAKAIESSTDATEKSTDAIDTETTVRQKAINLGQKAINLAKEQAKQEADARKKEADALNEKLKNMRREQAASRQIFNQAKGMGGGLSYLKDSFLNLGKDSLSAQVGLQAIASVAGGFGKAVMSYSKAIQQGQRGVQTSAQVFSDLAVPVSDLVGTIGSLALIAGSGRLGLGKFAARLGLSEKALKGIGLGATVASVGLDATRVLYKEGAIQADALFDSFNRLSAAGLAQARGMDDVFETMQAIGATTGDIEKFNSLMISNSKQIALLGDTAGAGARQLAKVAGGLGFSRLGIEFNRMGILQEELNELTLSHLSIEARLMSQRKKSDTEQIQSTARFVDELDQASKLTGASRKEAAEAQAAALANERFRAALIDAEARGDEQELARLKKAQEVSAMFELAGNKGAATGIRDLAAGRGAPTTEAGTQVMMSMPGLMSELSDTSKGTADIAASLNNQAMNMTKSLAGTLRYTGDIKAFLGTVATADTQALFAKALEKSQAEGTSITQALRELKEAQTKGTDEKGRITQTAAMVDAGRNMLNAALIQDKTLQKLDISVKLHQITAETYADAVKMFGKIVGGLPNNLAKTSGAEFDKVTALIEATKATDRAKGAIKNTIGGSLAGKGTEDLIADRMKDMSFELDLADSIHKLIMKSFGSGMSEGGIASGPASGHLALLHGTEAVIPLKGGSIPLKILGAGGIESGPVFNPQNETNLLLEKNNAELAKAVVTLDEILLAIGGGATITSGGGGGGGTAAVAQEALAEHDHAHPHGEKGETVSPEVAKQISAGFVNPLEKMVQTSGFVRNDGKTGHGAIDLAGKIGDKIMAPISGVARVLSEKESGGYGNMVEVTDEKTGIKHMLAHMDKTMVKTGDIIKAGQQIGTLGNTGKSTGAHLHHEMRDKTGKKIDPSQFYTGLTDPSGRPISRPGFGTTAGGAATGNPNIASQGRRSGATQYPAPGMVSDGLGKMSEKYETGGRGSGTVGWDKVGGTSYGKYQIASKVGAMKDFLKFAEQSGRGDVAKKLRDAGAESDTGGTSGKSVDVWKQMAAGGELGDLEHQFIKKRSFDPAMAGVKDKNLRKMIEDDPALKEMMWSTAVQHGGGGAAGIMNKTYKEGMSKEDLVKSVYKERGTRFGGSTEEVQKSVKNRFVSEEADVLAMMGGKGVPGATPGKSMVAGAAAPAASKQAVPAASKGGAAGGLMGMLGGMLGGGATAPAGGGGLMGMLGGMLGGGATAPAGEGGGTGGLMGMLGGMLGGGATAPGQPDMAGVPAGGAPGAIGTDISAITQAMQAQTAATQSAITTGMQDLTTRLVDKIGGGSEGGGAADPAVPTLLSEILSANREQTSAINRLIQAQTS